MNIASIKDFQGIKKVTFVSGVKPAAAFKGIELTKQTTATVEIGKDESELASWAEWVDFPRVFTHKGNGQKYLRMVPVGGKSTEYWASGKQVSMDEFRKYLTGKDAAKLGSDSPAPCLTPKLETITKIEDAE